MRSLAMIQAILDEHEARCLVARQRHLHAVADADKALAAELRRLETLRSSAEADRARILQAQRQRSTAGGPFVLRKMGEFLTTSGHWVKEPDEARYKIERFAYRAVAERQAARREFAEVRTWEEYQAELEQRRHAADDIGPEPPMPSDDATLADYNKWEKDHKAWEEKKFAADAGAQ